MTKKKVERSMKNPAWLKELIKKHEAMPDGPGKRLRLELFRNRLEKLEKEDGTSG